MPWTINYKTMYKTDQGDSSSSDNLLCPLCKGHEDKQEELMSCKALDMIKTDNTFSYDAIFGQDRAMLISSARAFLKKYYKREEIIDQLSSN